tara:strand:+ start:192 stop:497 length:306 start_codon:yes stop_codon:yes gene_type:complete
MSLSVNELMQDSKMLNLEEMLELNSFLVSQIKKEKKRQARQNKASLSVGDAVRFPDNDGLVTHGKVTKIMRTKALVDVGPCVWRVPMHCLTKVKMPTGFAV